MRWLWWVGSIKLQVSFAKETYKRDDILQKRPIILSILLTVATAYHVCSEGVMSQVSHATNGSVMSHITSMFQGRYIHWSRKLWNCETFVRMNVELYIRIWICVTADFSDQHIHMIYISRMFRRVSSRNRYIAYHVCFEGLRES